MNLPTIHSHQGGWKPPEDNALVFPRHRLEAVRSSFWDGTPPTWALEWARTGKGTAPLAVTIHHAQSLANLEAAVRREYAGLVDAARMLKARVDTDHVATASDCCDLLTELETLKNG